MGFFSRVSALGKIEPLAFQIISEFSTACEMIDSSQAVGYNEREILGRVDQKLCQFLDLCDQIGKEQLYNYSVVMYGKKQPIPTFLFSMTGLSKDIHSGTGYKMNFLNRINNFF